MTTIESATSLEATMADLAVLGQRNRLHEPGIALCGSRAAGTKGIEFAKAVGSFAAESNLSLVSGYAKGVDMAGHVACVEAGGHTIAVLAEGLGRFRLRNEFRAVIEPWENEVEKYLTVVSEFEHNAPWTVWRAMQRNALICSLAETLVAIDPGDSGGTLDAVKKAVKREMRIVIGWSNPEQSHDHLHRLLANANVSLVMSQKDLCCAIDAALRVDNPLPAVSQPNLF